MADDTSVSTIKQAPVHALAGDSRSAAKTLDRLLRENHASHAVLREPRLIFHNHIPHALGSSFLLGASTAKLEEIYQAELPNLIGIDDGLIRNAITRDNWRDFWGQKEYTAAYVDFFDLEIQSRGGDWTRVVDEYLYSGQKPLLNGLFSGLGHPFIHLAYGYEFNNEAVVSEALSLGCTEYGDIHRFFDSSPPDSSRYKTTKLEEVLLKVREDHRFDAISEHPGVVNIDPMINGFELVIREHLDALVVEDADAQLRAWMHTAVLLAINTASSDGQFDFFLVHILTAGHALRVLLPRMPQERRLDVMKHYGLFAILTYLGQLRPAFTSSEMQPPKGDAADWDWAAVYQKSLASKWSTDVHWPKVVRALRMAEELRGSESGLYRHAAINFTTRFSGWAGFGLS